MNDSKEAEAGAVDSREEKLQFLFRREEDRRPRDPFSRFIYRISRVPGTRTFYVTSTVRTEIVGKVSEEIDQDLITSLCCCTKATHICSRHTIIYIIGLVCFWTGREGSSPKACLDYWLERNCEPN